jgi:hypothetical protein
MSSPPRLANNAEIDNGINFAWNPTSERLMVILLPVDKEHRNQLMSSAIYENVSWRLIAIVKMFLLLEDSLYSSIVSTECFIWYCSKGMQIMKTWFIYLISCKFFLISGNLFFFA